MTVQSACMGALLCLLTLLLTACSQAKDDSLSAIWGDDSKATTDSGITLDLSKLQSNGEMIMLTLSSPDTYYDYRGKQLGAHFMLCQQFASAIGVSLRVELCRDTLEMLRKLRTGEADVIVYPLTPTSIASVDDAADLVFCGPTVGNDSARWAVTAGQPTLAAALDGWYEKPMLDAVKREEAFLLSAKSVKRHVYAPMQNRKDGIISRYDGLFVKYGRKIRWDWRLLAAQCYQESTFDTDARSWAGACGLMQIMPATAAHLGLSMSDIFSPEANIAAAVKYLGEIEDKFSDVENRNERINFILASYNGGYHHIRDAMRLAAKDGKSDKSWDEVSKYVLLLSDPRYYRDTVVKYGYMRGSETVDYVAGIRQRWKQYEGARTAASGTSGLTPRKAKHQKEKYRLTIDGE